MDGTATFADSPALGYLLAGRTAAAEQEGKQLRLGYFPNLTHAQALYARATGAFGKVGARIQWVAFNAGPTAIEALFTDAVDATFVGPSPTINGYIKSKGDKFVVVAGSASGGAGRGQRLGAVGTGAKYRDTDQCAQQHLCAQQGLVVATRSPSGQRRDPLADGSQDAESDALGILVPR